MTVMYEQKKSPNRDTDGAVQRSSLNDYYLDVFSSRMN